MKKLAIASAVSALFAAPTVVFAQAAAPTLDKVLDASGIAVSGYIDTAYSGANRDIQGGFSDRVFDSQNDSINLHQFGITVAKQPKEGFGGLVNFTVGSDARVIHSFPESAPTPPTQDQRSTFDVTQAFGQYATGALTVMFGKFTTLHGTEVIASTGNTNFSRSILFGAVPFTHTGVRATYAFSDAFSLTAGVNNGWDQMQDQNKGKTAELGLTWAPIKPLSIVLSAYSGSEVNPSGVTANSTRTSYDAVVTYSFTDSLSLGLEYLDVSQEKASATGSTAKYNGYAGYLTWMITPKWRVVLRGEQFDDKDNVHFAVALPPGTTGVKYNEGTLTVSYLPSTSFELRAEVRQDNADTAVFTDKATADSKSLQTMALQGIYKF